MQLRQRLRKLNNLVFITRLHRATKLKLIFAFFLVSLNIYRFEYSFKKLFSKGFLVSSLVVVEIQFLSGVVPLTEMAGFTPFLLQLLALRPSTCLVSGHPPSSNQSSLSLFTCFFQVFFGRPRFLLPLTSRFRATLKTLSSSLLSTCPYHLTPFAVANRSIVSFNPNISICSSVVFLSTTF